MAEAKRVVDGIWRAVLRLLIASSLVSVALAVARADDAKPLRGVALVIGNGDYKNIARLANPVNDARAIEDLLHTLGFETTMASDRDARRLRRDLEGFVEDAEGADVAVVYYSGHGIEAGGENYLVPVDADLSALDKAAERLVPLSHMIEGLKKAVPISIVLLDACRSDPFPPGALVRQEPGEEGRPIGDGGLGATRGAVALSQTSDAAAKTAGTVIGFAAEPGRVALDGEAGSNSPYAAAVLRHLSAMDGAEFGTVMRMVAEEVYLKTAGRQQPWVNESLRRLLYFGTPAPVEDGEAGAILTERRALLLTIAALPEPGRKRVEAIAQSGGVPLDGLYAMLGALGVDAPKDPGELDRLMRAQAERLKAMLAERAALTSADPDIVRLSALADSAIREGALKTAIQFLGQAKSRVAALDGAVDETEADLARKRMEFAAVYARSAEAHALGFDYLAAANDYGFAFDQVRRWDDHLAWTYKKAEAEALHSHGVFKADNAALEQSIAAAKEALRIADGFSDRGDWATTQNALGNALQALGERQGGTDNLDASIGAYQAALAVIRRDQDPGRWAKTRNNLANALTTLGTRNGDAARLAEAVAAFADVIDQFEKDGDKPSWAAAQSNGGKALLALGEIENSYDRLNAAGRALEAALSATNRTGDPLAWATMQNNLGNVFQALGIRFADPNIAAGRHLQAVVAYRNALLEMTRERVPLQWAIAQSNLANALQALGFRQQSSIQAVSYLRLAVDAHRAALEEMTRARAPLQWASVQTGLARTLWLLADRAQTGPEIAALEAEAATAYREALTELTPAAMPAQYIAAQVSLGQLLQRMSQRHPPGDTARTLLLEAEAAQRAALAASPRTTAGEAAAIRHDLGMTLMLLGPGETGISRYQEAEAVYRAELAARSRAAAPVDWARAQAGIGNALRAIGLATMDKATLMEARRVTQEAWDVVRPVDRQYDDVLAARLREIDGALATLQ